MEQDRPGIGAKVRRNARKRRGHCG